MSFFECEFPTTLSYHAIGGPAWSTIVNEGFSGYEQRNANWANPRGKWTVSLQTSADFATQRQLFSDLLVAFFLNVGGKRDPFRLKDHKDFQITAQNIGTGNGSTKVFQIVKNYTAAGRTYTRTIKKPIAPPAVDFEGNALASTVAVYLNGVPAGGVTVDGTTGLVTFGTPPGAGVAVTVTCQFHYPVRFDTDELQLQIDESDTTPAGSGPLVSWNSISLIEVRL
jgi:uncharacterized protein (TIGR02217 family)